MTSPIRCDDIDHGRADEGEQYQATVINTWAMTATPLDEPLVRGSTVKLPGKPYQALMLRRAF